MGKDTGLDWDGEKKTIAASDEWWEAKIQPVAEAMDSIAKKTIKVAKVDRRKAICNGFVKGYKEMLQSSDEEDPEVAKFREQGLKFLPEMEFLFKGTIAIGFAAYAPSKDSRQYEGFNTRT
ncbi:hypothetical protein JHK82_050251 [Glycine max]|nr:hypothetical protein JHK82_050251 [Glycine max]